MTNSVVNALCKYPRKRLNKADGLYGYYPTCSLISKYSDWDHNAPITNAEYLESVEDDGWETLHLLAKAMGKERVSTHLRITYIVDCAYTPRPCRCAGELDVVSRDMLTWIHEAHTDCLLSQTAAGGLCHNDGHPRQAMLKEAIEEASLSPKDLENMRWGFLSGLSRIAN